MSHFTCLEYRFCHKLQIYKNKVAHTSEVNRSLHYWCSITINDYHGKVLVNNAKAYLVACFLCMGEKGDGHRYVCVSVKSKFRITATLNACE